MQSAYLAYYRLCVEDRACKRQRIAHEDVEDVSPSPEIP